MIVVVAVDELLVGSESVSVPVTVAVLDKVPEKLPATVATTVIVAVPPLAKLPSEPVIVPLALVAVPWLGVAETKVRLAGKTSVTVTPVASDGPALVTVMV